MDERLTGSSGEVKLLLDEAVFAFMALGFDLLQPELGRDFAELHLEARHRLESSDQMAHEQVPDG